MSAADRTALAQAASTVEGIDVSPNYRQATEPGYGMVRLDRIEFPNRLGPVRVWQIIIIAPQDMKAAETWMESKADALAEALSGELEMTSITPADVTLPGGGSMPVLVIEGRR